MKKFFLLFLIVIFQLNAKGRDGHSTGNGGGGVVCPQLDGTRTVELLDLWEAEALRNMEIVHNKEDVMTQIERAILAGYPGQHFEREQNHDGRPGLSFGVSWHSIQILRALEKDGFTDLLINYTKPGVGIDAPRDALTEKIKKGCHLEGIGMYYDKGQRKLDEGALNAEKDELDVDPENYKDLVKQGLTHLAAWIHHEALYKVFRAVYGIKNSIPVRGIIGCSYSKKCPELSPTYEIPSKGVNRCISVGKNAEGETIESTFYAFPVKGRFSAWRFQVVKWGRLMNQFEPPARSYFDFGYHGDVELDSEGFVQLKPKSNVLVPKQIATTRSSDDTKRDIGVPLSYVIEEVTRDGKNFLAIDGNILKCEKYY